MAPVLLLATPELYLSRIQAVVTLCQTMPLIVGLNLGALIVSGAGVRGALLVMGTSVALVGVLAVLSKPIRRACVRPVETDPR